MRGAEGEVQLADPFTDVGETDSHWLVLRWSNPTYDLWQSPLKSCAALLDARRPQKIPHKLWLPWVSLEPALSNCHNDADTKLPDKPFALHE